MITIVKRNETKIQISPENNHVPFENSLYYHKNSLYFFRINELFVYVYKDVIRYSKSDDQ